MSNYTIDELRQRIDFLDKALLNILIQRLAIIPLVTKIKKKQDLCVYQPNREKNIYKSLEYYSKQNGVDSEFLKAIFAIIINQSKQIEHALMKQDIKDYEVFDSNQDKEEVLDMFNASFSKILELNSFMECLGKWHEDNNQGEFYDLLSTLTDRQMEKKYKEGD